MSSVLGAGMYKVGPGVQRGDPHQQPRHAGRKGTGGQGRKGTGAVTAGITGNIGTAGRKGTGGRGRKGTGAGSAGITGNIGTAGRKGTGGREEKALEQVLLVLQVI